MAECWWGSEQIRECSPEDNGSVDAHLPSSRMPALLTVQNRRAGKGERMKTQIFAGMAILAMLVTNAFAQKQSAKRLTADNTFMTKAAEGGMAEVEFGKLAEQHAANNGVKQFGKRMVDDHTKLNDDLKTVATKKGVTLPTALNAKDQATMDRLSKLNGAEFDRAYMADMVKDHRADITEFRREADHGSDPDVKNFASKGLPTIEGHLKMAEDTQKQVQ
jgi:predicted outer membrane protein